jgi:cyclopropane fatty-acyl-phospholipid synthase-like methyltransferase
MQYFWDWAIEPIFHYKDVDSVLEIGSSKGGNTDRILAKFPASSISVIDPCMDCDLERKYFKNKLVTIHKGTSLDILPNIRTQFDAILIDGDHNYFTVINELRLIDELNLLTDNGFVLLHDIAEPYARHDLYYQPDLIPEEAKHASAPHGVLTAVEDFLDSTDRNCYWLQWNTEHGLGLIGNSTGIFAPFNLRARKIYWHHIRWRNRFLRLAGLKSKDHISWGSNHK